MTDGSQAKRKVDVKKIQVKDLDAKTRRTTLRGGSGTDGPSPGLRLGS